MIGLTFGAAIGFVLAWAHLSDPGVIRKMLLLREFDVFFLMGSAVLVAAIGARVLRASGTRAFATGEPIGWTVEKPGARHVVGSLLFGAGWSAADTCPGPLATMIGEGRLGGLVVVVGIFAGVLLQRLLMSGRSRARVTTNGLSGAAEL
jgi:uncharacterized membrane protein YedE/YeeE